MRCDVTWHIISAAVSDRSWSGLRDFVSDLRLPLLFDLNALLRDADLRWNATNAGYVISRLRAELPVEPLWQLGNGEGRTDRRASGVL